MKNIVLIVIDTLRPDRLGCYGYERPTSPHLDRLAGEGTVLDALWSASNFTAPAFTSLFTGLHPHEHGVFDFTARAGESAVHDILQRAGYRTAGVVTFRFFRNLLAETWGPIEAVTDTCSFDYAKDLPMAVSRRAVAWLQEHGTEGPFCLFLHYDGPHMPYRLPEAFARTFDTVPADAVDPDLRAAVFPQEKERLDAGGGGAEESMFSYLESINWGRRTLDDRALRWLRDRYDSSVRYNDEAVGRVLEWLDSTPETRDTVVCVLSDHGEAFMEHGSIAHGGLHVYEEVIRTAGIIRATGTVPPAGRLTTPLGHVDVLPTLLSLAGVPEAAETCGTGFATRLAGTGRAGPAAPVFCQGKAKITVRQDDRKLILSRPAGILSRAARLRLVAKLLLRRDLRTELYDLAADPGETRNLARRRDEVARLRRLIDRHLAAVRPRLETGGPTDDETRRRIEKEMRDLGYM